jgi:hypothetical protein
MENSPVNYFQTAAAAFRSAIEGLGPQPEVANPLMYYLAVGLEQLAHGLKQHESKIESLTTSFATTQPPPE